MTRSKQLSSTKCVILSLCIATGVCVQIDETQAAGRSCCTTPGSWMLRLGALGIYPVDSRTDIPLIGGRIETPDRYYPGLDLSFFWTPHWSVELMGGVSRSRYRVVDSLVGDFKVGAIGTASAAMTLQYHFLPDAIVDPYIGVGANYARTMDVDPAQGIGKFNVDDLVSPLANLGVDWHLKGPWFLNASVRYLFNPAYDFKSGNFSARVKMNTLITAFGLGYRF